MDTYNRSNRVVVSRFGMSEHCKRVVNGEFFLNDSGLTLSPKDPEVLLPAFLDRLTLWQNDEIFALGKGAAQKNLDVPAFREIQIGFPISLAEQRRIVAILDEAFEAIATVKANTEKNLQDTNALLSNCLDSFITRLASEWKEVTLDEGCIIGDGNHSSNYPTKDELVEAGIPFIRATNLIAGRISGEDMRYLSPEKHAQLKKGHLKTGDILITNRGEIGKTAIIDDEYDGGNLNSQIAWLRCNPKINNRFLFHVLNSAKIKSHFEATKSGAALQQFTIKQIRALSVPCPSIDIQQSIANRLDAIRNEVSSLAEISQSKLKAFDELKKSLLHHAFTGQLTANKAEDMVEAVA